MLRQRITIKAVKAETVSQQSFSMSRENVLDVGAFYVTTRNGHSKGFTVATELAMTEAFCWPQQS